MLVHLDTIWVKLVGLDNHRSKFIVTEGKMLPKWTTRSRVRASQLSQSYQS